MKEMKKVGVNGFGRIGRYFTRLAILSENIEVALVNDITDIETLAHLLKYDSIHGIFPIQFSIDDDYLVFENGKKIRFTCNRNPELIPWGEAKVETVIESTGLFLTNQQAEKHIHGGAKKVIISAPAKDDDIPTVVLGVNEQILDKNPVIISNASCTTNNAAPMVMVMEKLVLLVLKTKAPCFTVSLIHLF